MNIKKKSKLLIISKDQFGYLTDTYKYCDYLDKYYDITFICLDWGKERFPSKNTNVIYVKKKRGAIKIFLYFLKAIIENIRLNEYDNIFCVYFRFCGLLPFFVDKNSIVMDIRTGSVSSSSVKRKISNLELKFNSIFFKKKSIISDGLAQKLSINKYYLLPLGADKISEKCNISNKFNLLYIGTFNNRRVYDTIVGYKWFLESVNYCIDSKYIIVGDGSKEEEQMIKKEIEKLQLNDRVILTGRKKHDELQQYFLESAIGVSYVPITDYYMYQSPTKTYEYIMSGLICIATETYANKMIINKENGVLCKDTPESFCNALGNIYNNFEKYNVNDVKKTVEDNNWFNIIRNYLLPILDK